MALSEGSLKQRILTNLQAGGFVTDNKHSMAHVMAEAIAKAVVAEIQENAQAVITSGSSAGSYKVE